MASIIAVYINLNHIRESFEWVQHTNELLLETANLDHSLAEAEAAERGYLITRDDDFRVDFMRLREAIPRQRQALVNLSSDNPKQQARLAQLEPLLDARLDQMDQTVALGPTQLPSALNRLSNPMTRRLIAEIRDQISEFWQTEATLLLQRHQRAEQGIVRSIALAISTLVLALTGATAVVWLFQRSVAAQRERELTTDLIHLARLSLMGQMASMLGHELTQPLTACGNYLRGMLRIIQSGRGPDDSALPNAVAQSLAQLDRAQEIIHRLRDFIRKGEPTKSPETVNELFGDATALLGMRSEGLTISTQVEEGLPAVLVDRIQIEQVLINLMRNAAEAMEHSMLRSINLSAKRWGIAALISVTDTGPGIPKQNADKLFQSFHTTKSNGMGVGLSICQTLITANGGQIWAETNPEGGATFCFTLPILPPGSDPAASKTEDHRPRS